ncbi:MAG: hypothetical protein KDK50_02070 [Chlamydiia bacterium]|nr:hypothetical protein [Chlamydiia bacterium]
MQKKGGYFMHIMQIIAPFFLQITHNQIIEFMLIGFGRIQGAAFSGEFHSKSAKDKQHELLDCWVFC